MTRGFPGSDEFGGCGKIICRGFSHAGYADCFLLILDAVRRAGITPLQLVEAAQRKMIINRSRTWPGPVDNQPVEHVR